ncbi:MAG: hypothetical protein ACTSPD_18055 [Promethearchaeota archaeon]
MKSRENSGKNQFLILIFEENRETFLAEGVFAVIKVKSNLDRNKLIEARNSLEKVKDLKIKYPKTQFGAGAILDAPLRLVFAYKGATWKTLLDEIKNRKWSHLFDLICILEREIYIKEERLISWGNINSYLIVKGKAIALSHLYYYLVKYCQRFLSNRIVLEPYFEPFNNWEAERLF